MLSRFIIAFLPKNLACSQTSRQNHILSFSFWSFSHQQLYSWKLELEFRSHLTWDQSLVLSLASFVTLGLLMECSESWFLCVSEATQAASEDCGEGTWMGAAHSIWLLVGLSCSLTFRASVLITRVLASILVCSCSSFWKGTYYSRNHRFINVRFAIEIVGEGRNS